MFSDRFNWDVSPNALSVLLQHKRSKGAAIVDLTESNPTRVGLTYDAEKILAALSQPAVLSYQPDARGLEKARQAIGQYYRDRGADIERDAVFLTAGTSEAYSILFKLLANPGDEILFPRPGYPLLSYLAHFEGLQPYSYPLRYDDEKGWSIDLEVLQALITPRSKAIVLVNPNNPTGNFIKTQELAVLDRICRRNDMTLIVDEVFSDFDAAEAAHRVPTAVNRSEALTFVLNGFSKMLALPQVKLGWIVVSGDSALVKAACSRLEMILDFYLSVATAVQLAAESLLGRREAIQRQILTRIDANGRFLEESISRTSNCRVFKREGGWYAVLKIHDAVSDADRILQLLEQDDTLVHPGYFYGFQGEGFVVASLLPPAETFQTGITRLISRFGSM